MKAWTLLAGIFTKPQHGTNFISIHAKEKRIPRNQRHAERGSQKQQRTWQTAAVHHLFHAILRPFQHVFEVRGLIAAALAPRPATTTAAAFPAATAALIIPGHCVQNLA